MVKAGRELRSDLLNRVRDLGGAEKIEDLVRGNCTHLGIDKRIGRERG